MNEDRRQKILEIIIREHIATGEPVSSSLIVEKYKLDISTATARNDMADLEENGFIAQPHTSAGRVPTEKAYLFFLSNIKDGKISPLSKKLIEDGLKEKSETAFKIVAKTIAKMSENAVFWAFHKGDLYYTGVSNLIGAPEFSQNNLVYDISMIIDRMDEIIDKNFEQIANGVSVTIGSDNLFSIHCSSVVLKYKIGGQNGIVGLLGPMRMDYERNLGIMKVLLDKLV